MNPALSPFSGLATLRQLFATGLADMLTRHDDLGVYILVLANAAQDASLWPPLRDLLIQRHLGHAASIRAALRNGSRLDAPADDLLVFLKLMALDLDADGFEQLRVAPPRQVGAWEVQFNPLRGLRPARMSEARAEGMLRPFDAAAFHFNKPFLSKEILWAGSLAGKPARLLYNKFPFAPLHGLLAPEPELQHPQYLTPEMLGWACDVAEQAGAAIPGFGLAYNSYGAYSSVNHLHFQTFVRPRPLPLQLIDPASYPLSVWHFSDPTGAWFQIDALHAENTPYNLIFGSAGVSIIARARQGEVPLRDWSPGFAWSEVAGAFSVSNRADHDSLSEPVITQALAELRV